MDQVRERIHCLLCSLHTGKAYVYWATVFVLWTARSGGSFRHPRALGQAEVEGSPTKPPTEKQVAPATRRQARNARLFLYRQVLGMEQHRALARLLTSGARTRVRIPNRAACWLPRHELHEPGAETV